MDCYRLSLAFLSGVLIAAMGCSGKPTYPKAQLTQAIQQLMAEEGLRTSVRSLDHTLALQVIYPNSLIKTSNQIEIGPGFDDVARKLITQLHRVLLSTDADINFYVVLLSDPSSPGAYLTMVRYMDDVRRANASMLDTPEMFARTVFEVNVLDTNDLTIDQYVPRDIRLEEFLSWQLARRIQSALAEQFHDKGTAEVGRCRGVFKDGEFSFTLDLSPLGQQPIDDATIQSAFKTSTEVIGKVLSSYRFQDFQSVRLVHSLTGRNLVLPKSSFHPLH